MQIYHIPERNDTDTCFIYIPEFLSTANIKKCETWLDSKYTSNMFNTETNNKKQRIVRKQMWFQENNGYFCEKWRERYPRWKSKNYDSTLYSIQKNIIQTLYDHNVMNLLREIKHEYPKNNNIDISLDINSCLVNLYETGKEKISKHRDNKDSFGEYPTIIGLSIGATRTFKLTRIDNNNHTTDVYNTIEVPLEHNSLFMMLGSSQKYYVHELLKEPSIIDKRYSFTFRKWSNSE